MAEIEKNEEETTGESKEEAATSGEEAAVAEETTEVEAKVEAEPAVAEEPEKAEEDTEPAEDEEVTEGEDEETKRVEEKRKQTTVEEQIEEGEEKEKNDAFTLQRIEGPRGEDETEEGRGEVVVPTISGAVKAEQYLSNFLRNDHPPFNPGDTIRVHYKIIEGSKERIQVFEGIVIAIKHKGLDKTFKVRKVTWGVGVERTFFYNSQKIDKIVVVRRGKVRRAKVYFLRDRVGKAARIKELRKPKKAE